MYVLLAIAILCSFALLRAAIAIARHVPTRRISAEQQTDFAHHLFAAAKASWNRALEPTLADTLNQSISSMRF
jgi:hypothetical protein